MRCRSYDTVTEAMGPVRTDEAQAEADATAHNDGCATQGGYGSAIVIYPDPTTPGRAVNLAGQSVWPPHGRTCGAVRFGA